LDPRVDGHLAGERFAAPATRPMSMTSTVTPPPVPALALAHLRLAEGGPEAGMRPTRSRTLVALLAALTLAFGAPLLHATTSDHPPATVPGKPGIEDDGGADAVG
jgi:hypothetical protein